MDERGRAMARGRLEARLDLVLHRNYSAAANRRLAKALRRERDAMFAFLLCPGLDAADNRAGQAIRLTVVKRKVWGGNRTEKGAHAQSVLASILQTCRQQCRPATAFLEQLLHLPKPQALELIFPTTC